MSRLPETVFRTVLEYTPLVSIDLLAQRPSGELLVGWRENRPARHHWFVPGGRIAKNETRAHAFARITETELGRAFDFGSARLAGSYDHIYPDNVFGAEGYGTHYVVLGYQLSLPADFEPTPDSQHERFRWITLDQLRDEPRIHENTRAYHDALAARAAGAW